MTGDKLNADDDYLNVLFNNSIHLNSAGIDGCLTISTPMEESRSSSLSAPSYHPLVTPPPLMHILTPTEETYYDHHLLHVEQPVDRHDLIMWPKIRGTPPDTPPMSGSPSPTNTYRFGPRILYNCPSQPLGDEMLLPNAYSRSRLEPLDLRPTASELHRWNVMQHQAQQHTSVIVSSASGKQTFHHQSEYSHQESAIADSGQHQHQQWPSAPVTKSARTVAKHSTTSRISRLAKEYGRLEDEFDEDTLVRLTVKELNVRLKGKPKEYQDYWKLRRRTLKNRGYAKSCRNKRVIQKDILEKDNKKLRDETDRMRTHIQRLVQENESMAQKLDHLVHEHQCVLNSSFDLGNAPYI